MLSNKIIYRLLCIFFLYILISCSRNPNQIQDTVKIWNQKHIILPIDSLVKNEVGNGIIPLSKKIKILTLIDGSCSICRESIKNIDKIRCDFDTSKVGFIIVWYSTDQFITLENMKDSLSKYQPYYFDRNNYFITLNKFPVDPMYHTFLLDSANNIVLIGAIINEKMHNLYKSETNKLISNYFKR